MIKIKEILVLSVCVCFLSCKKENGKHDYEMRLYFESGDVLSQTGRIFEKYKKSKKYKDQVDDWVNLKGMNGSSLFVRLRYNHVIFLKTPDNKLICEDSWKDNSMNAFQFANGQSGELTGEIYMEGSYTQKGRAYTVENGNFEFYWRNATDFGMNDTILKGTWSLKRK